MTARYVYWKTPSGAPYKGNDNKHAPHALLSAIGKNARINSEGALTWPGMFNYRFELSVLGATTIVNPDGEQLNSIDKASIIRTTIYSLVKKRGEKTPVDAKELIQKANNEAAKYFRKKCSEYVLVTTLSVKSFPANRITIGKCLVNPLRKRDRYPYPDVLKRMYPGMIAGRHSGCSKHQLVRVRIAERSIFEAAERAIESLALLRGLWNLFATRGSWSMRFGRHTQKPIGVVHAGPIHTLHNPDGKPVDEELYWYEADVLETPKPFEPKKGWNRIERDRRWAMRRLRILPYARDLRRFIIRYAEALDSANPDVAFLRMWGILESLTNTIGAHYDETINRATWISQDRPLAKDILGCLRRYRNEYVHAARSADNRDQAAQEIKSIVDAHILCLLRNDFNASSIVDYASFLSLPTSIDKLRASRRQHECAIRLRELWIKNS